MYWHSARAADSGRDERDRGRVKLRVFPPCNSRACRLDVRTSVP
jgi:hypothetical protein